VAARLQAEILEPRRALGAGFGGFLRATDAIAVHRAVEIHAGNARAVRCEHAFDDLDVTDVRGALVVNHDVVAFRIIGVAENRKGRARVLVGGVGEIDFDVRALLQSGFEDILLLRVIVAAAAHHEEGLERRGSLGGGQATGERRDEENGKEEGAHRRGGGREARRPAGRKATALFRGVI
jgi:hypothetical protein